MLTHLRVRNIALIDDIALDLDEGLNIFTGETGAGKSIIMGAVSLALGARVSRDLCGKKEQGAQVDLLFDVSGTKAEKALMDMQLLREEDHGELVLSRYISPAGRAVNHVNEAVVTAATLQKVAALLIDVHGQHEHQSLLDASRHIDLLDRFDPQIAVQKEALRIRLQSYKEKEAEYRKWMQQAGDKDRILSLMEYEATEIDSFGLQRGEEEELIEKCRYAQNAARITECCQEAYHALRGSEHERSGLDQLNEAISCLQRILELDKAGIEPMISSLLDAVAIADQMAGDIQRYQEQSDGDPQALAQMEERLDQIRRLKSKYGQSYDQIMKYRQELAESMARMENLNETLRRLQNEMHTLYEEMDAIASDLSKMREAAGKKVSSEITEILQTLQFQDPEFSVSITPKNTIGSKGRDQVQFLIRTNVGDSLRPLDKIASGGEISRIMLAIKTVLADKDEIPTLIFDEIDTGISGRTAQSVAEKLAMIARYHQIICITHLPQIASMADHHFCIEKIVADGHARTVVNPLQEGRVAEELARMLGGTVLTDTALQNAEELKKLAEEWKKQSFAKTSE